MIRADLTFLCSLLILTNSVKGVSKNGGENHDDKVNTYTNRDDSGTFDRNAAVTSRAKIIKIQTNRGTLALDNLHGTVSVGGGFASWSKQLPSFVSSVYYEDVNELIVLQHYNGLLLVLNAHNGDVVYLREPYAYQKNFSTYDIKSEPIVYVIGLHSVIISCNEKEVDIVTINPDKNVYRASYSLRNTSKNQYPYGIYDNQWKKPIHLMDFDTGAYYTFFNQCLAKYELCYYLENDTMRPIVKLTYECKVDHAEDIVAENGIIYGLENGIVLWRIT